MLSLFPHVLNAYRFLFQRQGAVGGVGTVALVVLLLCGAWLLGRFDLPASMLPGENIFDIAHYREELAVIWEALEGLPL